MEIIQINQAEMLQAINKAEVDIQIATAKMYPRDIHKVLSTIETYATMDTETAEDCFYALRRGKGNDAAVIEGLSVRMAEIVAGAWGNIRVQTRIIGNDGKTITAMGICHDLETNFATSVEVKRRITDRFGKTFSEDMQVVTGNAASAIAFRNAVFKVIPKAVTKKVIANVKQVALGQAIDLETSRKRMIDYFAKIGVTQTQLLEHLEIKNTDQIDKENILYLRSLANAIKEGTTSVKETFGNKFESATDPNFDITLLKTEPDIKAALLKGQITKEQADKLIEEIKPKDLFNNGETKEQPAEQS